MTSSLWLAATGDLMLTHPPADSARIKALFRDAELVVTNLELPLTDRGIRADKLVAMRASPTLARELPRMGIHAASLGNNHALDYGVDGLVDTVRALSDAGVYAFGTGLTREVAAEPAVVEVNGLRVALISYTCTAPAGSPAGPDQPGLAAIRVTSEYMIDSNVQDEQPGTSPYVRTHAVEAEVQQAEAEIRRARELADLVVVAIHWGVPYGWAAGFQGTYAEYQRPLGRRLVEAGAHLIIGNHAHMPHGVEVYQGVPILYSIGNFMFHSFFSGAPMPLMRPSPPYDVGAFRGTVSYQSFIALARLTRAGVAALEIHPITLDAEIEPVAASPEQAHAILDLVQRLSPDPTRVEIHGTTATVRLTDAV